MIYRLADQSEQMDVVFPLEQNIRVGGTRRLKRLNRLNGFNQSINKHNEMKPVTSLRIFIAVLMNLLMKIDLSIY